MDASPEETSNFPEADFWTVSGITGQARTGTHLSGYGVNQELTSEACPFVRRYNSTRV